RLVALVARSVFGIEADLVPPNGSGDTTWSYISTLNGFVLAVLVAAIWSAVGRVTTRRLDHVVLLDLLRSYLRYVLAFAMLGYGLAKVSMGQNQFSVIGDWQLKQTWGDCSPMGVVWKFMGASRPYTIFAGLGEVLAALLLIWRRTCSLGALVAIAVMSNVVMLNFCYDVPVKLYSSHLLLMAILIVMPDAARLCGVLVLNRATTVPAKRDLWMGPALRWVRRVVKAIVILYGFAWPVGNRVVELASHFAQAPEQASDDGTAEAGSRLTRRGFRWINEVPFNR
ncbi:MAG TPA: hypothetical protein VFZ65_05655, partial [Planctomycetota bacterium]|nr:hypothetical protein [Planctomycetota bacterium]